jgi:hypothetical protein
MLSLRCIFNLAAMTGNYLLEIERAIHPLSADEKLWLLERIIQQLREPNTIDLSEMAADPQIQAEIGAIEQEFALTEMDGLQSA